MTTSDVAHAHVSLCREGRFDDAIAQLYAEDIVSIEPVGMPEMPAEIHGIEGVRAKNEWWGENNEVHGVTVEGPFVGDGHFAVRFTMDTTFKPLNRRTKTSEMALFTVKDGKIVKEEFYYHAPGE